VIRIEMHRDAAERGNDIADPRQAERAQRPGKRLQRGIGLQVHRLRELGVHRRIAERRQAQALQQLLQWSSGTATPIMQSRVTIEASFSSLQPSVPAGRFGSTR